MSLPRYFIPRPGGAPEPVRGRFRHLIDAFSLSGAEWMVGIDTGAQLDVRALDSFDALPPRIRAALSFHEVAGVGRRVIHLESVFVFEMRLLEQAPDCPGVNDPVHLYGTLVGPLTSRGGLGAPPIQRWEGQLTVSRGDVLTGMVAGARWAFRCTDANGRRSARVLSMMMGADRYEAVVAGQGAVIVYPMLGLEADVYAMAPGNEEMVNRLLYDLLFAWWTDMAREAGPVVRPAESLPVPSRAQHEHRLERAGFTIEGDVASRPRDGWAGALPGPLGRESRRLPPEGGTDDFLRLAAEALVNAPQWPSLSGWALTSVVRNVTPAAAAASVAGLPAHPPIDRQVPAVSDWIRGFVGAGGGPPPHLTPGPDDPSQPRALLPLDESASRRAAAVLDFLAWKFDRGEDP